MKFNILLFSRIVKEPTSNKRWPIIVYKTMCFIQYITTFFAIASFVNIIISYFNDKQFCDHIWVPFLWYLSPFAFYYIILYFLPLAFVFILGIIIFKILK
jgi:hypothetical protein